METIKINIKNPKAEKVKKIVDFIKAGKTVILPSDTTYGLCASGFDVESIKKVISIKKRAKNKPLSVFVRDIDMAKNISFIDKEKEKILSEYLPGLFTFILTKKSFVPDMLTAGSNTVGIRISKNVLIREIMKSIDYPIIATSANLSGESEIYSMNKIIEQIGESASKPDLVVDGGDLPQIKPSTVVDLTCDPPKILRAGPVEFQI